MTAATALVVDDEPMVRHLVRRILEPEICGVMEVEDGESALRLIQGRADSIDVVLTDLSMPGIDGFTVAEVLTLHQPALPVLCMSAYVAQLDPDHRLAVPFIQKPFTPEALCEAVTRLIARSRALRAQAREERQRASGGRRASTESRARTGDGVAKAVDLVAAAKTLQGERAKAVNQD
jgi:CheY-like chemotaxis protein